MTSSDFKDYKDKLGDSLGLDLITGIVFGTDGAKP